jgi:heme A synthase
MEYIIGVIVIGLVGYMWVSKNKPEWLKKLKK